MSPWLFTTFWGALYLSVLTVLMGPCLLSHKKRWLAAAMFFLFACDRASVNLLPPDLALFFLAVAYMLVSAAVVITHTGGGARLVGGALLFTSLAFILGGFGVIDWDITGSLQEAAGLVAMLAIIGGRYNGTRVNFRGDDRAIHPGRDIAAGNHARRGHRK